MTGHLPFGSRPDRSLLAAVLSCMLAGTAHAQAQIDAPTAPPVSQPPPISPPPTGPATPLSIGASETLTHESNLFRQSSNEASDLLSTTALNLAVDEPIGRQRLHGNAALQLNRYRDHSELNNTGHELGMQLDWETINSLAGVLGVQSARHQYRFGLDSTEPSQGRNIESTDSGYAQARLGGMGLWSLLAGANTMHRSYSDDTFAALNDLSQWSIEGGMGYRPSPDLSGNLLLRTTRISRPDALPIIGDDVSRRDAELGVVWQASGASRVDLRATRSQEKHSVTEDRSFWTGAVGWDWMPSAKLHFRTQVLRDTEGSSGNVAAPGATTPPAPAGDQLRDAIIWSAQWAASAKINVIAGAQWSHRHLRGELLNVPVEVVDRTTALTLGVRYSPARALDLGCDLASEKRNTNGSTPNQLVLTRPYDSLTVGCVAQFWFR